MHGSILDTFCFLGLMGHFLGYFLTFQSHFWTHQRYLLKKIIPMCLYDDFEPLYSLKFFHLSRFRN